MDDVILQILKVAFCFFMFLCGSYILISLVFAFFDDDFSRENSSNESVVETFVDYDIEYCRLVYRSGMYETTPCIEVKYNGKLFECYTTSVKIDDSCFVRVREVTYLFPELHLTMNAYNQVLKKGGIDGYFRMDNE